MDKELKLLQETICQGCPFGADNMKACDIAYCDKKEAFNKVEAAYEKVKKEACDIAYCEKDLAGRQKKKSESLSFDTTGSCWEGQVD